MTRRFSMWVLALILGSPGYQAAGESRTYRTPLLAYPAPWAFQEPQHAITLVGDSQLEQLAADPDEKVNLSVSDTPRLHSLREVCRHAEARGCRTLSVAFDHFWASYRQDLAGKPRRLWPDMPRYIELIGKVAAVAKEHGLGMKLSVLSPLEIGHEYREETGENGRWMHYRKGLRDVRTGAYSVQLWRQLAWTNNKGTVELKDAGLRVFAFRERRIPGTHYVVVKPQDIVDITETANVQVMDGLRTTSDTTQSGTQDPTSLTGYRATRIRVHGEGRSNIGDCDRVLVVQMYQTPEMDYFSESADQYLRGLIDRYVAAGIHFNALYGDEMHIQGDWGYDRHHDHGEFALRYVSPGFARRFSQAYGDRYEDFAKWLIYFCHGQQDTVNDLVAWNERFGSWMTQYAYTNYMPQAQVVQLGVVRDGVLQVGNAEYSTLVVGFEPFPDEKLLAMMTDLASGGGRVIWSGPPPRLLSDGRDAKPIWEALTGARHAPLRQDGRPVPGSQIGFRGALEQVKPFTVLTDLLPDRVYPLELLSAAPVAHCGKWTVGAHRNLGRGTVTTLASVSYLPQEPG